MSFMTKITAIFTAANARVRLYSLLEWIDPSQFTYTDTDSCFILYDENNQTHKYPSNDTPNLPANVRFGNALGQWEDELKGGWITEFVGGGAKSYAYKKNDGTIKMKQKRITLDMNNRAEITYDRFKDLSLNWNKLSEEEVRTKTGVETKLVQNNIKSEWRYQFAWVDKNIVTKWVRKSIKSTVNDKRCIRGFDTYPYGFDMSLVIRQMEN
jgi:hypothetical protein